MSKSESPSKMIDGRIKELGDWRGETLARVRAIIKQADPDVIEEWKWRGVPVWEHDGIICTGETYKAAVKLTFAKGASLDDPSKLLNSSLEGNTRRAIDIHEGEKDQREGTEGAHPRCRRIEYLIEGKEENGKEGYVMTTATQTLTACHRTRHSPSAGENLCAR